MAIYNQTNRPIIESKSTQSLKTVAAQSNNNAKLFAILSLAFAILAIPSFFISFFAPVLLATLAIVMAISNIKRKQYKKLGIVSIVITVTSFVLVAILVVVYALTCSGSC